MSSRSKAYGKSTSSIAESMKRLQSNSERGNAEIKLGNEQPFAIEVKGGGKEKSASKKKE